MASFEIAHVVIPGNTDPYRLRDAEAGEIRTLYEVRPDRIVTFGPVG